IPARLFLMGRFNLYNALAAITSTLFQGIPVEIGLEAIREVHGINGRFERVRAGQDFTVIVDYAHTPDGLENVLSTIRQFAKGRILCVVGAGGERDRGKRPKMARVAQSYAEILLLTSDNPRREDPLVILKEMEAGLIPGEKYVEVIPDRREAIERAVELARPGDVLLIAGKGHETYQILGTQVIHFDDREVVREAIRRHHRA
ncbi:MAG: UDP-N-acetylmuramyl-tripeptide synthetase, partial [Thermicanus sp.]|nr:UDP-N-acetylmuramyl-tripeptide synthetase [Thermicanus sp.]